MDHALYMSSRYDADQTCWISFVEVSVMTVVEFHSVADEIQ